ncbi:MBL fold metallo-hydrolase [Halarcobacter mediterraneus]|uniref:MBL fold metallo-hydrolase n=1 Tax=Halarcobacter mediterraneus TaxID=2023153 RepID=A0A4Q1AWI6_9BACT|nr:MBL fold metallo-hydrolase [Halarcobacter mediterraneus]RXK12451.1 MBL fold metallo-hydrolase [Halarcobacter mediterraneus]
MAYYSSYGAAQGVTGSCHLLEVGYLKILVDCGLFQGRDEELNIEEFEFDPSEIDYVIITHAHLDHIGRLPLLVKEGFNKKIISTRATYEIAKLMLANAAGIIQESKNPIYNENDVEPTLRCFGTFLEYNESMQLSEDIKISFKNAGHILGSASLKIEYKEDGMDKSAIFSGDLGQDSRIITSSVQAWEKGNYIFLESTYGDRLHDDLNISINSFKENILKTINNGGVVLLPSFALERTQELLYLLKQMSEEGLLSNIPVYLDAPLATNVTKVFKKFPYLMNDEIKTVFEEGNDPFSFKELKVTLLKEESIRINEVAGPKIIIAGSGMCEGGRIKYHLVRYLQDPRNKVIFVGFQVPGTLGRKISDSANETIKIDDTHIKVKADIEVINGFSAHADQGDLINFVKDLKDVFCIYLIHGDEQRLKIFKEKINDELESKVHIVKKKERIYI